MTTATLALYLVHYLAAESDKLASAAIVEKPDVPATCHHAIAAVLKALNAYTGQAKEPVFLSEKVQVHKAMKAIETTVTMTVILG
jgi:hypothetical protein